MDGIDIQKDNYVAASGSTIVMLEKSYLKSLSQGEHILSFIYTDGLVDAKFTIININPKTEDSITYYINMFCLSSLILI